MFSGMQPGSISVVIPAYNAELYLADTLRSALAQTLPPLEILVMDDGSSDRTAAIAESFGPPVCVIRLRNSKAATARNLGVEQARGEWIAFLDADDIWEPRKLELQMRELLMEKVTFMPSVVVIRRSTFLASGGFDPGFRFVEDWELWMRLLHAGVEFAACPEPLLQYRLHPTSTTTNALSSLGEAKLVYRRHIWPHLPPLRRYLARSRFESRHETDAAYMLRKQGDRRHLRLMFSALLKEPLHDFHRYKVFAHMMFARLRAPARSRSLA